MKWLIEIAKEAIKKLKSWQIFILAILIIVSYTYIQYMKINAANPDRTEWKSQWQKPEWDKDLDYVPYSDRTLHGFKSERAK